MNISESEKEYSCMQNFMVYSIENLNIKLAIKLMYAFKVSLSFLFVIYLLNHNLKLLIKYKKKQKVDRLTLISQWFFMCSKFCKLLRDGNFYQLMHH